MGKNGHCATKKYITLFPSAVNMQIYCIDDEIGYINVFGR